MKIKYKEPKPLMQDLLFQHFQHNQYFKFSDFAQKINSSGSHYPIDYDMMKDFLYEMLDQKKIEQLYVGENENPFLPAEQRTDTRNKSIHFKRISEQ